MACSIAHVERPSSSTSGGQSLADSAEDGSVAAAEARAEDVVVVLRLGVLRIMSFHAEPAVHCLHGLPSGSRTIPDGRRV
jgi:hypothetical protein